MKGSAAGRTRPGKPVQYCRHHSRDGGTGEGEQIDNHDSLRLTCFRFVQTKIFTIANAVI